MIWILNSVIGAIFDALLWPFLRMNPWFGMIAVSWLTALLMLFIFRRTSNQDGIRAVKNKIKAYLLELRLYKDSLGVSLKAQGQILLANLKYIGYNSKPMLVMIVPILLILIQLNLWFGAQALSPGQTALVKMKLDESRSPAALDISARPSAGLTIDAPPLRIEDDHEIDWRLRVLDAEGVDSRLTFVLGERSIEKKIEREKKRLSKVSAVRPGRGALDQLLNPGEPPIPGELGIKSIEIVYPGKKMHAFGFSVHWLVAYFILSIVFGFAFKGLFKVEI